MTCPWKTLTSMFFLIDWHIPKYVVLWSSNHLKWPTMLMGEGVCGMCSNVSAVLSSSSWLIMGHVDVILKKFRVWKLQEPPPDLLSMIYPWTQPPRALRHLENNPSVLKQLLLDYRQRYWKQSSWIRNLDLKINHHFIYFFIFALTLHCLRWFCSKIKWHSKWLLCFPYCTSLVMFNPSICGN